ncbi:MAG: hypothetical protein QXE66_01350 [Desulfurococcaceae archaeon]
MPAEILKKYLMEGLKRGYVDSLWFSITKQELLIMSEEELEIVESFAKKYYRGQYRLHPKSFYHFIRDQKYEENCTVDVDIPLEELVKRGILTAAVEGGKTYWYLYGEKLDPKTHENLYKKDWGTFKTLLEELGLGEFMNEFNIDPSLDRHMTLFSFEHGGLRFSVEYHHKDHPTLTLTVYTHAGTSTATEEPSNPPINISVIVKNPKVEDVYKVEKLVKELRSDIEQKISRISNWIKKSCRYSLSEENMWVSGSVSVRNYEFDTYWLSVSVNHEVDDRTKFMASVNYYAPRNLTVSLSQTIGSQYLVNALNEIDANFVQAIEGEKEYIVRADRVARSVTFEFKGKYSVEPDLGELPDISGEVDAVMNMKSVLRDIIIKGLNKLRNEKVRVYTRYDYDVLDETVEDFMKFIGWREDQTPEEAVLKVWLLRTYLISNWNVRKVEPDIISLFISLAYLSGAPYDYVLEKVSGGLDYVVGLARRGRLRIVEDGVYLDGRKVSLDPASNNLIKSVVELVAVLSSEEERSTKVVRSKKIST